MHYIQNISILEEIKDKNYNFISHLRNITVYFKAKVQVFLLTSTRHTEVPALKLRAVMKTGSPGTTDTGASREASPRAIPSLKVTFACARSSRRPLCVERTPILVTILITASFLVNTH